MSNIEVNGLDPELFSDEESDEFLKKVIQNNEFEKLIKFQRSLKSNQFIFTQEVPEYFKEFFLNASVFPDWIDEKKMEKGFRVFEKYGLQVFLALFCRCIPEGNAHYEIAKTLFYSKNMKDYTFKRILETAHYAIQVLSREGFQPNGIGILASIRVRIIHSSVRIHILKYYKESFHLIKPINQELLLLTVVTFSLKVTDTLKKIGIPLTREEEEGFFHLWMVVGHFNGVSKVFIPKTMEEGWQFMNRIEQEKYKRTSEGVELTNSLVNSLEEILPSIPFAKNILKSFMKYILGKKTSEIIGLDPSFLYDKISYSILYFFSSFHHFQNKSTILSNFTKKISTIFVWYLLKHNKKGEPTYFRIPYSLRKEWNLSSKNRIDDRKVFSERKIIHLFHNNTSLRFEAYLFDISLGGMKVYFEQNRQFSELKISDDIELKFTIWTKQEVIIASEIKHIQEKGNNLFLGLKFKKLNPKNEKILQSYIHGGFSI